MQSNHRLFHQDRLCWVGLGVILSLALVMVLPAAAQDPTAIVRSDPAVLELAPGEMATLTVVLAGAQNVYGIDVRAAFDPQLVEVVDADPASEGVQLSPGTFPQPDFPVRNEADNQAGTLRYVVTQVNPTEPVSGDGVIFTVQLRALADSGEGAFTIGPIEMADRTGNLLAVQTENGLIRISPAEQQAPTEPAPATPPVSERAATDDVAPGTLLPVLAVVAVIALIVVVVWAVARRRAAR